MFCFVLIYIPLLLSFLKLSYIGFRCLNILRIPITDYDFESTVCAPCDSEIKRTQNLEIVFIFSIIND
jgi:hypothetical protein